MKNKLIYPMVVVVLAACGGDGEPGARAGQQYETVQEGSASGVTSTIAGPGETLPPITGTNDDSTSAFALNPTVAPQPVPGTGAIPSAPPYADAAVATMTPMAGSSASVRRTTATSAISTQSQPQRQPARPAYNPPPMTSASQPVQQEPAQLAPTQPREAQPVDPQPATVSGPASDTTATDTAPPPPPAQEQPQQQPEPSEDEPAEEEAAPAPPPPVI